MDLLLQTLANGVLVGAGYAVTAVGLTVVFGILGIVNFAHGAFFALGAYAVFVASSLGLPYPVALPAGVALVVVAGWVTEVVVVRRSLYGTGNHGSLIVTFALAQAMTAATVLVAGADPHAIATPLSNWTGRAGGILFTGQRLLVLCLSVLLLGGFALWLKRTTRGRQVTAVAQNPRGALYSGINVPRIRTLSFMIGVGAAGIAGGLLGPISNVFPTMGNASLISSFIVVILGGLGSISGSMAGALLVGVANALFETYVSVSWTPALGWGLVIAVLLLAPQGLRGRALQHRY
jgi:branched-chain amino acid transport system permease protein